MIFGQAGDPVPPIFIAGNPSTGKTSLVRDMMESLHLPHAYISCIECSSQRSIFESILNQLNNHIPNAKNNYSNFTKCSDLPSFIENLQGLGRQDRTDTQYSSASFDGTRYVVFDNAERLRQYESSFFFALLRLDELAGVNICAIFISSVLQDHFEHVLCTRQVLRVHFDQYSKQEVHEILLREPVQEACESTQRVIGIDEIQRLHHQFVRMLLEIFWPLNCRNVEELRCECSLSWEQASCD
jgi:origin recognition complex subunit 5